ncbi:MAG TPA: metallophosphoesterase [Burkholderiaceae bacterium]|nr:metallophosphoesterase [Burkholderiaceae bacterium]
MPLSVLSLLVHAYIAWRLLPDLVDFAWAQIGIALLVALSAVSMQAGFSHWRSRRLQQSRHHDIVMVTAFIAMGFLSSLFVLTLLRDVALAIIWIGSQLGLSLPVSTFAVWSALVVPAAATLMTLWGLVNARRTARVVKVDVPIVNLPASLDGFTIAQISDIHVGQTIKGDYLQSIVGAVNSLQPDMVAVTGDLVDGSVAQLRSHVEPLRDLTSRHGTYFVTGNHEYYSGVTAWVSELRRLGINVLLNEHVVLQHNDHSLVIAGVTDYSGHHFDESHRSDAAAAIASAPDDVVRILLAHQPRSAAGALQAGFDLQLSGHTHGGQFWPWNFFVRLQQPFTAGLHRLQSLWVYTSRGTGYWGPPKRFGAPSEITHLRLVSARP